MTAPFTPSRQAGLAALAQFAPRAGRDYASSRNHDLGPGDRSNVSMLSPYLRHRLVTEPEVVRAVLAEHSLAGAEKFVQEVFWRTYWKGWLELRPEAWRRYRRDVRELLDERDTADWRDELAAALSGATGIDCFDAWVGELATEGYLHNHVRMWFASIWIFTLKLPWQLGADLFYRQLIDGDAASNTLSWRWVAGLQTPGKTYLATAQNIASFTEGRFSPRGLASHAEALTEPPLPPPIGLPEPPPLPRSPVGLLLHDDDLHPKSLELSGATVVAVAGAQSAAARSPLPVADAVASFASGAITDALDRASAALNAGSTTIASERLPFWDADAVQGWAAAQGVDAIVTAWAPVGPTQEALLALRRELAGRGITLATARRAWDTLAWRHATRGFFPFRERIPALLRDQGIGVRR